MVKKIPTTSKLCNIWKKTVYYPSVCLKFDGRYIQNLNWIWIDSTKYNRAKLFLNEQSYFHTSAFLNKIFITTKIERVLWIKVYFFKNDLNQLCDKSLAIRTFNQICVFFQQSQLISWCKCSRVVKIQHPLLTNLPYYYTTRGLLVVVHNF